MKHTAPVLTAPAVTSASRSKQTAHLCDDEQEGGHRHDCHHLTPDLLQAQRRCPAQLGTAVPCVSWIMGKEPVQKADEDADQGYREEHKPPAFPSKDGVSTCNARSITEWACVQPMHCAETLYNMATAGCDKAQ